MPASWGDRVWIIDKATGLQTDENISLEQLRDALNGLPPYGGKEVRFDAILDLTDLGAKYKNVLTLPAGALVKYAGLYITETVVAGSTTVKVALGPNGGDVDKWGISADLVAATKFQSCFATVVAASEVLDVTGVVTNGSALGDTNISAGKVRVVIVYEAPNTMTATVGA